MVTVLEPNQQSFQLPFGPPLLEFWSAGQLPFQDILNIQNKPL